MRWIYRKVKSVALTKREAIFAGNEDAIILPDNLLTPQEIKSLLQANQYKGKNITRRLIEYFHSPIDCHPENMVTDQTYAELMKVVYPILSINKAESDKILSDIYERRERTCFSEKNSGFAIVRNEIIPLMVQFFHIRVFNKPCTKEILNLLSNNVLSFKETISFISLPDIKVRQQVLSYIRSQCDDVTISRFNVEKEAKISHEQISKLIMGVFFHTGVIQISEFVAHTIIALAQNEKVQNRLRNNLSDDGYLRRVLEESLRLYPLFGITNRIAEKDFELKNRQIIPKGMNILFNFVKCHALGFKNPTEFDPDRWLEHSPTESCYMPFGAGPRMCPAKNVAYNITTTLVKNLIKKRYFYSSIEHDRPLTGGGLVYFSTKNKDSLTPLTLKAILSFISIKEALCQLRYAIRVINNCNLMTKGDFLRKLLNNESNYKHVH